MRVHDLDLAVFGRVKDGTWSRWYNVKRVSCANVDTWTANHFEVQFTSFSPSDGDVGSSHIELSGDLLSIEGVGA